MYKTILLAVDGSVYSLRAAREAARIANCMPVSHVTILYVPDDTKPVDPVRRVWPAEDILQQERVQYDVKIVRGEPVEEIVEFAEKQGSDLLVLGSRGLNSFQRWPLGNVTRQALFKAPCPILVVK